MGISLIGVGFHIVSVAVKQKTNMGIFDFFLSADDLYRKYLNKIEFDKKYKNEPPTSPREAFLSLFSGETKDLMSRAIRKNISNGGALGYWIQWLMSFRGVVAKIKADNFNIVYTFYAEGSTLMTVTYRRNAKDFLFDRQGCTQIHVKDIE